MRKYYHLFKFILISLIIFLISFINIYSEENRGLQTVVKKLDKSYTVGKQYLLIIAIDKYKYWNSLKNPVKDAKEIKDILINKYYIDEVIELYNEEATKENILKKFISLKDKLKIDDSLLIYYAGHGHLDEATNTGFWIPVDGGLDVYKQENWLPNIQVRGFISNLESTHICLISDSCFSGDILNTSRSISPEINSEYFKKAFILTSRQVLTSGASETVPDDSEFSRQLKMALKKNKNPYLDPLILYNEIRLGVTKTIPMFGHLKETGHQEGASFLLFLKLEDEKDFKEEEKEIVKTKEDDKEFILEVREIERKASGNTTITGILNLPEEVQDRFYFILIDDDTNAENKAIVIIIGKISKGKSINYKINNVPAGSYFIYAIVKKNREGPPEKDDYIGFYMTTKQFPREPNCIIPISGTVNFDINMRKFVKQ